MGKDGRVKNNEKCLSFKNASDWLHSLLCLLHEGVNIFGGIQKPKSILTRALRLHTFPSEKAFTKGDPYNLERSCKEGYIRGLGA